MSSGELSPLRRHRDVFRLDHAAPTQRVRLPHGDATAADFARGLRAHLAGRSRRRPRQPDRKRRNALLIRPIPPPHPRAEDRVVLGRPRGAHDRPPSSLPPAVAGPAARRGAVGSETPGRVNVPPARNCSRDLGQESPGTTLRRAERPCRRRSGSGPERILGRTCRSRQPKAFKSRPSCSTAWVTPSRRRASRSLSGSSRSRYSPKAVATTPLTVSERAAAYARSF